MYAPDLDAPQAYRSGPRAPVAQDAPSGLSVPAREDPLFRSPGRLRGHSAGTRLSNTKEKTMSLTADELKRRIDELQASGMHLAARALIRELHFRQKDA
jgi:hypothetical protein